MTISKAGMALQQAAQLPDVPNILVKAIKFNPLA
jgi:hypothetical protein